MNSTPVGVEEKEESRFVDYTIASDFEKLVSTIEGCFKSWMKDIDGAKEPMDQFDFRSTLDFGETKLILSMHRHDVNRPEMPLPLWFSLGDGDIYAVISKLCVWSTFTTSERKYLLGALVSGLNSTGFRDLSVFTTASDLESIANSPEVDGYCARNGFISKLSHVEHYESVRLTSIDVRHPLFYLDGMCHAFFQNIVRCSNEPEGLVHGSSQRRLFVSLDEVYHFGSSSTGRTGHAFTRTRTEPGTDLEDRALCTSFLRRAILTMSSSSTKARTQHPVNGRPLERVSVGVRYLLEGEAARGFADNRTHSTLSPFMQPPSHWKVQALFEEGEKEMPRQAASQSHTQGSTRRLSAVLRRLLGLYIHGKTSAQGVCMGDVDCFEEPSKPATGQRARQQAKKIGMILSPAVQQDLRELCGADSSKERDDLAKRELVDQCQAQRDRFFRLLFPGANGEGREEDGVYHESHGDPIYPEGLEDHSPSTDRFFFGPSYAAYRAESVPLGGWLSMCALCVGSLYGNLGDVSVFWRMCIDGLRSCFEEGIEIADLDAAGSNQSVNSIMNEVAVRKAKSDPVEERLPMWQKTLWGDALQRKNLSSPDSGGSMARLCAGCLDRIEEPALHRPLSVQKVQMILFCSAMKDEESTTTHAGLSLSRRMPLTSDTQLHQRLILSRMEQGHKTTEREVESEENRLLRWQVMHVALVSDLRAYKASRQEAVFEDFLEWYGLVGDEDFLGLGLGDILAGVEAENAQKASKTREDLRLLWGCTDGCFAREQKPLFRPETEVEKCISYFETLTPLHFASEMLCAALEGCLGIAESGVLEVLQWMGDEASVDSNCHCGFPRDCPQAIRSAVMQDLDLLREDVKRTIGDIQEDVPSLGAVTRSNASQEETEAVSQSLLLSVDSLCEAFDRLEDFEANARTLLEAFQSSLDTPEYPGEAGVDELGLDSECYAMIVALAFSCSTAYAHRSSHCPTFVRSTDESPKSRSQEDASSFKCRSAVQKDLLWQYGRNANRTLNKRHAWHSEDARELGHAAKKLVMMSSTNAGATKYSSTQTGEGRQLGHFLRVDLSPRRSVARLSFRHVEQD